MSDREIVLVIGLPGSGKTGYAESVGKLEEKRGRSTIIIDDPRDLDAIGYAIDGYQKIVITDPGFCLPHVRDEAELRLRQMFPDVQHVAKVYFDNDPVQCIKNDEARNRKLKSVGMINFLSRRYVIPEDIIPRKVWRPNDGR